MGEGRRTYLLPHLFTRWDGRRTKTHISPLADEKGGDSVYTTLIQVREGVTLLARV